MYRWVFSQKSEQSIVINSFYSYQYTLATNNKNEQRYTFHVYTAMNPDNLHADLSALTRDTYITSHE